MDNLQKSTVNLVKMALKEDIGPGDMTSLACLEPQLIRATISAKSEGIFSGLVPATMVFKTVDSAIEVDSLLNDGDRFNSGDTIIELKGFNQTLLAAERTVLNFMAHLSGVATLTNRFVQLVKGSGCRILDTRKTIPGWRLLEKQAVVHGGGGNHRFGLYDMILIKDNHIAAAGSVQAAIARTLEYLGSDGFGFQFNRNADEIEIEVEIDNIQQLTEAIESGAGRLLLDNQSVTSLREMVNLSRRLNPDIKLEASGNISLDNVSEVAATGVDFISIGALTHSAPASDFSLGVKDL